MTRLFTDGAEMGDSLFWDLNNGVSAQAVSSGGYGAYVYQIYDSQDCTKFISDTSECYARVRFWCNDIYHVDGGDGVKLFSFRHDTTEIARIGANSSNYFTAVVNGGTIATGIRLLNDAQWYLLEIYFKMDNPSGRYILNVNGITDIDYTGNTTAGLTHFNRVIFGGQGTTWGHTTEYIDDLALNDTNNTDGKNDNSWCGDGFLVKITPSGSGTHNNWFNSGSISGSSGYLYVDEYPKDDDTTYVYASGSSAGLQQQFAMSNDFDTTNKVILRIYTEARAKRTGTQPSTIKIGFLPISGSDTFSSPVIPDMNIYTRITGDGAKINPATSASWVKADIDGLEFINEIG